VGAHARADAHSRTRTRKRGAFSRLGGLGMTIPIGWRANLRGHYVGWAF